VRNEESIGQAKSVSAATDYILLDSAGPENWQPALPDWSTIGYWVTESLSHAPPRLSSLADWDP
jgi:hypothetical protein